MVPDHLLRLLTRSRLPPLTQGEPVHVRVRATVASRELAVAPFSGRTSAYVAWELRRGSSAGEDRVIASGTDTRGLYLVVAEKLVYVEPELCLVHFTPMRIPLPVRLTPPLPEACVPYYREIGAMDVSYVEHVLVPGDAVVLTGYVTAHESGAYRTAGREAIHAVVVGDAETVAIVR
jgi:hypothetical protein